MAVPARISLAPDRRVSPARVALVALGLVPTGAVAGGLAGAIGVSIWVAVTEGITQAFAPDVWLFAGMFGAALGAVLLPIAGFTLLRRAPLGRVLAETILGTALGGALGAIGHPVGMGWLGGALAGFAVAAAHLWWKARPETP